LRGVEFLKELSDTDLDKLGQVMTPHVFQAGDYLVRKGDTSEEFFIVRSGTLKAVDIMVGGVKYEDKAIKPGDSFGEYAIVTGKPRAASIIAETAGAAFKIDKTTFQSVLGDFEQLVHRSMDKTRLVSSKSIDAIQFLWVPHSCTLDSKESKYLRILIWIRSLIQSWPRIWSNVLIPLAKRLWWQVI
jgi:CRP-like cAMP-binding protein